MGKGKVTAFKTGHGLGSRGKAHTVTGPEDVALIMDHICNSKQPLGAAGYEWADLWHLVEPEHAGRGVAHGGGSWGHGSGQAPPERLARVFIGLF